LKPALFTLILLGIAAGTGVAAAIPATPVMTVYRFDGPAGVPYYQADDFLRRGTAAEPAGFLAQGTSVIPCLVLRGGRPITAGNGTPYVGFEIVVDARRATGASADLLSAVAAGRTKRVVRNHHCPDDTSLVIDARLLHPMARPPLFDPPPTAKVAPKEPSGKLDAIIRAFHRSPFCAGAGRNLVGRRDALASAWSAFTRQTTGRWDRASIERARHLDYVMRTVLFEGHLGRGCSAYGACERNVIALSIRNRAVERCRKNQGCRYQGDFEGVASKVSQYNIWDEYLTQVSGLTSCFLREDLSGETRFAKIQAMYAQSQPHIEAILFGSDPALGRIFRSPAPGRLKTLRHYYHPPAMGKCFPEQERMEYISAAVARRGGDFVLLANTRVDVGRKTTDGYAFRTISLSEKNGRDRVAIADDFPGFLLDPRKVELRPPKSCTPYGTSSRCSYPTIERHRKTPPWLDAGDTMAIQCNIADRGQTCQGPERPGTVGVGGRCDIEMQPVAGVP
jgi:hypothetical protein